jgi:hypothetical protein
VIRLGLRLTLRGGREAAVRLAVTAASLALGAALLLITLAGINAVNAQNARYAWLNTGAGAAAPARPGSTPATAPTPAPDAVWWLHGIYDFDGQDILGVYAGATGPRAPVPPGIPRLPAPGQFYASPALTRLLRGTPAPQLADAFPGRQAGIIGPAALPSPDSLVIIAGRPASQLAHVPGAARATRIQATVPSSCDNCVSGINANGIDLILGVVILALLFPVLTLTGTATRLAAARREQRFAAMRLAGATPRQVSVISAVESAVAAIAGTAAGFGLFFALRTPLAAIPFTGSPFFPADLSLSLADILAIAIGVPVASAAAARVALRRVNISPLGVSRRVTPRPPRAYQVIPLLAGLGELAGFTIAGRPSTTDGQVAAYFAGFLLVMAGLVSAGPWLTMAGARLISRRTRRPAALIAGRRLADSPQAGFRAISGLVLALFVASVAVGTITAITSHRGPAGLSPAASSTVADQLSGGRPGSGAGAAVPAAVLARLHAVPGARSVTLLHANPLGVMVRLGPGFRVRASLVSCAELARTPVLGRCAAGATVAAIAPGGFGGFSLGSARDAPAWPAVALSPARLQRLPVQAILVSTSGSAAAVERVQAVLEAAYPVAGPPDRIGGFQTDGAALLTEWQQLANVVILVSLPIAGCTLAVSVAAGLSDRKRPFSLLRLAGAPLSVLRRVIALESAVPLLVVAVVSIGTGFLATQLFLASQLHYSLQPPGPEYYAIVAAGLLASLGVIVSTLPLLSRITGPETARSE